MKIVKTSRSNADRSVHRNLLQSHCQRIAAPGGGVLLEIEAAFLFQHGHFPKSDGGDRELVVSKRLIDCGSSFWS